MRWKRVTELRADEACIGRPPDSLHLDKENVCEVGDALYVQAVVMSTLSLTCASTLATSLPDDPTTLAALQAKADQAQPRNGCFLYAKLVSQMTDLAGQQFHSRDSARASETLKRVQQYAEKIHMGVANDSKKLQDP